MEDLGGGSGFEVFFAEGAEVFVEVVWGDGGVVLDEVLEVVFLEDTQGGGGGEVFLAEGGVSWGVSEADDIEEQEGVGLDDGEDIGVGDGGRAGQEWGELEGRGAPEWEVGRWA